LDPGKRVRLNPPTVATTAASAPAKVRDPYGKVARMIEPSGPYVAMAVLCDRVDPRDDGTVDVFGIVDGVVLRPEGDDALGVHPAAVLNLKALLSLKAGLQRGSHEVSLSAVYPSGSPGPSLARPIDFTDDLPGASFVVPLEVEVHEPGQYAFDVRYDGRLMTRISLQVVYSQ
jgi:hypothetical protein